MNTRAFVFPLAAGELLSLGCTGAAAGPSAEEPVPVAPSAPPPWDDETDPSRPAPQPTTNPPIPRLVAAMTTARRTPDGKEDCGQVRRCPPWATEVLDAWRARSE
jgi:hypothetical protein